MCLRVCNIASDCTQYNPEQINFHHPSSLKRANTLESTRAEKVGDEEAAFAFSVTLLGSRSDVENSLAKNRVKAYASIGTGVFVQQHVTGGSS